jgi:hypothetical protein
MKRRSKRALEKDYFCIFACSKAIIDLLRSSLEQTLWHPKLIVNPILK